MRMGAELAFVLIWRWQLSKELQDEHETKHICLNETILLPYEEDLYLCCKESLILIDDGFLFRNLDRAWSPFPNGCYRPVCRNSLSYEITGQNGACTTKPSDTVNRNRHFFVQ